MGIVSMIISMHVTLENPNPTCHSVGGFCKIQNFQVQLLWGNNKKGFSSSAGALIP